MNIFAKPLHNMPLVGIDPEVLEKINAFLGQPERKRPAMIRSTMEMEKKDRVNPQRPGPARRDASPMKVERKKDEQEQEQQPLIPATLDWIKEPRDVDFETDKGDFCILSAESKEEEEEEEEAYDEKSLLLSHKTLPFLRIIARAIYPSKHPAPPLPPRPVPVPPLEPPTLTSLLGMLYVLIIGLFIDATPAIIEYLPRKTKKRIRVQCEARAVEFPATPESAPASPVSSGLVSPAASDRFTCSTPSEEPKNVIKVVALLHVENDVSKESRVVHITAKSKRVRQLLKDWGVDDLAEDVYRKEIKGALKRLGMIQIVNGAV